MMSQAAPGGTQPVPDAFAQALIEIRDLALRDAAEVKRAPLTTPVRRLDDVRAAKQLDLTWLSRKPKQE